MTTTTRRFKSGLANCFWFGFTGSTDGYSPAQSPTGRPWTYHEVMERVAADCYSGSVRGLWGILRDVAHASMTVRAFVLGRRFTRDW